MTREALKKLTENQLSYCKTCSSLIAKFRQYGSKERFERQAGKLRGFLECLCMTGVLTGPECKALYLYFFSEDRW